MDNIQTLTKYSRQNRSPWGVLRRSITVRTDFVGFHKYESAPVKVAFLKNNHRHKFYVEARIEVLHDDRELEFFSVLDELETEIIPFLFLRPLGSCEMIAEDILWGLLNLYGDRRFYTVVVSEDKENEAQVDYDPN